MCVSMCVGGAGIGGGGGGGGYGETQALGPAVRSAPAVSEWTHRHSLPLRHGVYRLGSAGQADASLGETANKRRRHWVNRGQRRVHNGRGRSTRGNDPFIAIAPTPDWLRSSSLCALASPRPPSPPPYTPCPA